MLIDTFLFFVFSDLNDPSIFRDLSKPIGALNPERLHRLKVRPSFLNLESFMLSSIAMYMFLTV